MTWQRQRVFLRRGGEGPVLLLIHGFPTSSWDWHSLWDELCLCHTVIAPDLLGFGSSSKPFPHRYCIDEQAGLVEAVLKHCGFSRADVIAHDYGNTVAQELLARANTRQLGFALDSLVFLNGGLFPECHRPLPLQKLLASSWGPWLQRFVGRAGLARSMRRIFGPDTQPDEATLGAFWGEIDREHGRRVLPALLGYIAERHQRRERWVGALQQTSVPIGFIDGEADPISGAHMADRWAELVPDAALHRLPGIGHYPQIEAPERVLTAWRAMNKAWPPRRDTETTLDMPTPSPKQLVSTWVERFNAGDADGLAELYADDAVNHQVVTEPLEGRAAIHRLFTVEFARADMVCIVENLFEDGEWAILEWRDPKGLRGCGFFHVRGGQIVFQRGYFDQLSFFRQQGLPILEGDYLGD